MVLSVLWTKSAIPTMSKVAKETHCSSRFTMIIGQGLTTLFMKMLNIK